MKKTKTKLTERLYTPRPMSDNESSVSSFGVGESGDVFIPAEGESFDNMEEGSEDDNGMRDPKVVQDGLNGTRVEYIDCPQKAKLYHAAKNK